MQIKVHQFMATRGSYVHNSIFGGHPKNVSFIFCNFLNIDGFRQNNSHSQGF